MSDKVVGTISTMLKLAELKITVDVPGYWDDDALSDAVEKLEELFDLFENTIKLHVSMNARVTVGHS